MSNKLTYQLIKTLLWVLLGVSAALIIYIYLDPLLSDTSLPVIERAPRSELGIYWAYILVAIAIFVAVLFPIIDVIKNPKSGLKIMSIILLMAIILVVSYFLADATPLEGTAANPDFKNPTVLKLTDTGLYATYFLVLVSILTVIVASIRGLFSK